MNFHTYVFMNVHTCICTYIHTYTHTYYFLLSYVTLNTNGNLYVRKDLSNVCITMFMYGTGSTVQYVLDKIIILEEYNGICQNHFRSYFNF